MRKLATGLTATVAMLGAAGAAYAHHAGETETLWEAIADHVADHWVAAVLTGIVLAAFGVMAWRRRVAAGASARQD